MIPNAGLDNVAAYNLWQHLSGSSNPTSGNDWMAYAAISEDSTEPQATDTNIGSEKARTNSTGGFSHTATAIRDTGTNRLGLSIERAYVFNITENFNITKYGYVPVSSSGNFSWIDLTRVDPDDPESAPVTLNLVNGDQLQIWRTLTITVPWSVDLEQFVITGTSGNDSAGTHDAYCGFYAVSDALTGTNNQSISDLIARVFSPGPTGGFRPIGVYSAAASTARDAAPADASGAVTSAANATLDDYVAGNYYRDKVAMLSTSEANMVITAVAFIAGTNAIYHGYGFKVVFDDPSTFTKANTHELTLTFRVSWQEG